MLCVWKEIEKRFYCPVCDPDAAYTVPKQSTRTCGLRGLKTTQTLQWKVGVNDCFFSQIHDDNNNVCWWCPRCDPGRKNLVYGDIIIRRCVDKVTPLHLDDVVERTEEEQAALVNICKSCENLYQINGENACKLCGCTSLQADNFKKKLLMWHCPIKKW